MNTKQKIKLYLVAAILGAGLAFEISRPPVVSTVQAKDVAEIVISATPTPTIVHLATPTPTPTSVPVQADMAKLKGYYDANYGPDSKRNEYIDYVWAKWAGHGIERQIEAICTNFSEGHFTDGATNDNGSNGVDRGCWQWNNKYNPGVTDEMARNCIVATDLAYDKWVSRGFSFAGYWYGFGSDNYYRCLNIIN